MEMYKRERKYKSSYHDLEIVQESGCKIVFYILGVVFWKLLEAQQIYSQLSLATWKTH
jgi:hypothetical protein